MYHNHRGQKKKKYFYYKNLNIFARYIFIVFLRVTIDLWLSVISSSCEDNNIISVIIYSNKKHNKFNQSKNDAVYNVVNNTNLHFNAIALTTHFSVFNK